MNPTENTAGPDLDFQQQQSNEEGDPASQPDDEFEKPKEDPEAMGAAVGMAASDYSGEGRSDNTAPGPAAGPEEMPLKEPLQEVPQEPVEEPPPEPPEEEGPVTRDMITDLVASDEEASDEENAELVGQEYGSGQLNVSTAAPAAESQTRAAMASTEDKASDQQPRSPVRFAAAAEQSSSWRESRNPNTTSGWKLEVPVLKSWKVPFSDVLTSCPD